MENEIWSWDGLRYYFEGEQKTEEWLLAREYRVTGSVAAAAIGRSRFQSSFELAQQLRKEIPSKQQNEVMLLGIKYEPEARQWYEQSHNIKVKEVGFVIDSRYPYLGVSPDGMVNNDGLIEIKCPKLMYAPLREVMNADVDIRKYKDNAPLHVWKSHYDQMQMQMAIMGRKWCDYVVYAIEEDLIYEERFYFDEKHWNVMKIKLDKFVRTNLKDKTPYLPLIYKTTSDEELCGALNRLAL